MPILRRRIRVHRLFDTVLRLLLRPATDALQRLVLQLRRLAHRDLLRHTRLRLLRSNDNV
jgi:hypothetical protein